MGLAAHCHGDTSCRDLNINQEQNVRTVIERFVALSTTPLAKCIRPIGPCIVSI